MEKNEEMKLELERKIRMRDNLIKEQELYGAQLPELIKRLEIHREASRLLRENQKIILEDFNLLKPNWSYETNPEYLKNLKELNILNFKKVELDWGTQEQQMVNTIDAANKQLNSSKELLENTKKEIEKLEGDLDGK